MKETVINIYPILQFIIILLATVGIWNIVNTFMNLLSRFAKDKLDNKKDMEAKKIDAETMQQIISKYPDVKESFILKTEKEQNIENNQEIHEINKKFETLEKLVKEAMKNAH